MDHIIDYRGSMGSSDSPNNHNQLNSEFIYSKCITDKINIVYSRQENRDEKITLASYRHKTKNILPRHLSKTYRTKENY